MAGVCNSALMVMADWEQLVSVELEATHMFQFSRRKVPVHNGSVKSCQDGSVLFLLLRLLFVGLFFGFWLFCVALVFF